MIVPQEKWREGPVVCASNTEARLRRIADFQAGTDAGTAINTAIAAAGQDRPTTLLPGKFAFSTPIAPVGGMVLRGVSHGGLSNDLTTSTHLSFVGGATDSAIIHDSDTELSRIEIAGLRLIDDRSVKTSGNGILLKTVKNRVVIREMLIGGFPDDGIYVGANTNFSSDCVTLDDLWVSGGRYGINLERLDNAIIVRGIKGDSYASAGSTMVALVRVGAISTSPTRAVLHIEDIKHECSNGADTVLLDQGTYGAVHIDSAIMRSSTGSGGGYVVRMNNSEGTGVVCTNVGHDGSAAGTIRNDLRAYTITTNPVAMWAGGLRGIGINDFRLYGLNGGGANPLIGIIRGHLRFEADNTYDFGRDSLRPRHLFVGSNVQIGADLDHDGTKVGFFGTTPATRAAAYTVTNGTTDRTFDANATTTDELADVLATLIADLKSYGLLQ